jgi:hypothetical protein
MTHTRSMHVCYDVVIPQCICTTDLSWYVSALERPLRRRRHARAARAVKTARSVAADVHAQHAPPHLLHARIIFILTCVID